MKLLKNSEYYGFNMYPSNSYVEAVTSHVSLFEDRTYEEIIKVK